MLSPDRLTDSKSSVSCVVAKKSACNSNRAAEENCPNVALHGKFFHAKGMSPFGLGSAQEAITNGRAGHKKTGSGAYQIDLNRPLYLKGG